MTDRTRVVDLVVGIKGAGEMATGVAWRLYKSKISRIFMMEIENPLAVRRGVAFCEAVHLEKKIVEGVEAVRAMDENQVRQAWEDLKIPVLVDPQWEMINKLTPHIMIDATVSKKNIGTSTKEAPLVIGLGPGFEAGLDVHVVVETNRGHNLGRVIDHGCAEPNTGIPGTINGFTKERVLRSPAGGIFLSEYEIGMEVHAGNIIGHVHKEPVQAKITGVVRGLIKPGTWVKKGIKIGDVDPRSDKAYCWTISDKARAVAGGVLEAILRVCNR